MVFPNRENKGTYLILDGLLRWDALKNMGEKEVFCLIATEDDSYTYNHKVNKVSPIQETFMIQKAIERGVPEERIAKALNIDPATVRRKRNLLEGVCAEAVELLKDSRIASAALAQFKRVKPARQIEMAELMGATRNFTASAAHCMYLATPPEQRLEDAPEHTPDHGISPEESVRLHREMSQLHRDLKAVADSHGETSLNLVMAVGYLKTLIANARVLRHLTQHHPTILAELQKIITVQEQGGGAATLAAG
jgi:ParB-like chromosome segregation protein Spo0J